MNNLKLEVMMAEKGNQAPPGTQVTPGRQASPRLQAPPGPQAPSGLQGTSEEQAPARQQASAELINQLKNRDSSVRQNAAETIGNMRDEKAVDSLIPVFKDHDRFVRQGVVWALGKIGGVRALEALNQALIEEKDEFVKDSIKRAIERLQPKSNAQDRESEITSEEVKVLAKASTRLLQDETLA
jgi:HEAT repeat protein